MSRKFDYLGDVEVFLAVVEHGSFTAGAVALSTTPSVLSRAVTRLEARLGRQLLQRTTRRVGLTDAGRLYLEQVRIAFGLLDDAERDVLAQDGALAGRVRLSVPTTYGHYRLPPVLARFAQQYPQVQVELCVDPALTDLVAEGFDAGIRLGESLAQGMIAVPVGPPERQVVVATPAYFERHGVPQTPHDLQGHACIVHRLANGRLMPWEFSRDGHDLDVQVSGRLVFNDAGVAHGAVLAGLGMAQGFASLMADDINAGRLQSVLQDWQPPFPGFHLYYPAREQMAPKLRVFIDHLRAEMHDR